MPVSVQTDYHKYPSSIKQHLIQRFRDRRFTVGMAQELAEWLKSRPTAPSAAESPAGWHRKFSSFIVCGEDEFIKTIFTIYAPGSPRRHSVDLGE
jgi:hypothetical protein